MNYLTSELVFYILAALALVTALLVVLKASPVGAAICMALSFACAAGVMFQLDAHFLGVIQILVYTGAIMVLVTFVVMLLNLETEKSPFRNPWAVICGVIVAVLFSAQIIGVVYTIPGSKDESPVLCNLCNEESPCILDEWSIDQSKQEGDNAIDPNFSQEPPDLEGFISYGNPIPSTRGGNTAINPESLEELILGKYFYNAVPAIGHSPAIKLPDVDPAKARYIEGTNLAANVERGNFPDTALLGHRLFSKYNRELVIAGLSLLAATIGTVVLSRRPRNN